MNKINFEYHSDCVQELVCLSNWMIINNPDPLPKSVVEEYVAFTKKFYNSTETIRLRSIKRYIAICDDIASFSKFKLQFVYRILFVLPDAVDLSRKVRSFGVSGSGTFNKDDTFNMSWPIKWKDGRPEVYGRVFDIPPIYDGISEYYFLKNWYKFRDPSSIRM